MVRDDGRTSSRSGCPYLLILIIVLLAGGGWWWWAKERRIRTILDNERHAENAIRALSAANYDFRARDWDDNKIQDFWTGDVAGLNGIGISGKEVRLIPLDLANADAASLSALTPVPYHGYYFVALQMDESGTPPEKYQQSTDAKSGKVHHLTKFGYCAYPAKPGVTGRYTIIINENNTTFRDTRSTGTPPKAWPSDNQLRNNWVRNCDG